MTVGMEPKALARTAAGFLWGSGLAPVVVVTAVVLSILYLPPSRIPEPTNFEAGGISRVFDVNGQEIGQFRRFEQNIPVKPSDIPLHLKQAVIASEDQSFYSHGGIDVGAMLRALAADIQAQEFVQGGSTITQQYVRNAYTGRERTVGRKFREVVLASQLNRRLDKDDILFKYLSTVYLGEGAYGVGAASETYFRKPVSRLSLSEAALLAGLIPAPSRYEPRGNPGLAEEKRLLVLEKMLEEGYITSGEHAVAAQERVWTVPSVRPGGPATIIHPPQQVLPRYPYFMDYLRRYLSEKYGEETVFKGGLEVHTTLDPKAQAAADKAIGTSLAGTSPPVEMALAAVEPHTGFVKAMVGGRDFHGREGRQVNMALGRCPPQPPEKLRSKVDVPATCWDPEATAVVGGGGSGRQPGSAWKPFVLAAALEKGIDDTKVYSAPGSYRFKGCRGDGCVIQNYDGSGGGRMTLRQATVKSINTVYAQVIQDVGVKETGEMAKKLGITSAWVANPEVHGPSYSIGVQEVAPLDMASAFGVFGNRGERQEPTPVVWIKARGRKTLEDNRHRSPRRVLSESLAFEVTDILKGVIANGTGTRADIGRPAAGKTGTAQEWRDAWFVGYTPALSAAVWIGNRDRPTSLFGVKGVPRVFGGSIPAETWKAFMAEALRDVPPTDFTGAPAPLPPLPDVAPPTYTPPTFDRPTTTTTYDFGTIPPYNFEDPTTTTTIDESPRPTLPRPTPTTRPGGAQAGSREPEHDGNGKRKKGEP